ncbi:MAG: 6-pyruvoyl-tetrahydropterin synthase-related protein [archaeon]|nr:6-pyruvoyl-tetrahydropterin synthase-related protein [archaeon]
MGKNFFLIAIVILFSIIAGASLLHNGLPPTHDGEYHVIRFYLFNESFNDGNFYPRWAAHLNNNFGAPLLTFVYPLPNYIATFLHKVGVSFIDSFKFEMFAATLMGGVFFYLWAKEFWGKLGGVVSSVFYTFSPYHFLDIYIRGSVGEVWALAFFPAFLWAYTRLAVTKQKNFLILSSFFLALIIFSHNILALMFFPFVILYIAMFILKEKNKKHLMFNSFLIMFFGLGLSAIFWLPAIYETKLVTGLQIFDVSSHFPDLYQLLIPSWGSGFSGGGLQNELSFQIGIANLIAVFLSLIVIIWQIKKRNSKYIYTVFFLAWFIFTLYLMLNISLPVWKIIPLMNYFQFPWRLLSLEILFASFLAGSILSMTNRKYVKISISVFLIFLAFILGIGYAKPAYYHYRNDEYYISRPNFIDGTNSPGNVFNTVFLKTIPAKEKQRAVFIKGSGEITLVQDKSNIYNFEINSPAASEIIVNLAYYPGWEVYSNNKKIDVEVTANGRFSFSLPSGRNKVEVVFKDTFVRKISALISLISLLSLLILLTKKRSATINK